MDATEKLVLDKIYGIGLGRYGTDQEMIVIMPVQIDGQNCVLAVPAQQMIDSANALETMLNLAGIPLHESSRAADITLHATNEAGPEVWAIQGVREIFMMTRQEIMDVASKIVRMLEDTRKGGRIDKHVHVQGNCESASGR